MHWKRWTRSLPKARSLFWWAALCYYEERCWGRVLSPLPAAGSRFVSRLKRIYWARLASVRSIKKLRSGASAERAAKWSTKAFKGIGSLSISGKNDNRANSNEEAMACHFVSNNLQKSSRERKNSIAALSWVSRRWSKKQGLKKRWRRCTPEDLHPELPSIRCVGYMKRACGII